jgi:hypothetical protein
VNVGKNHLGNNGLVIYGWEIFGSLIEQTNDFTDVTFAFHPRAGREDLIDGRKHWSHVGDIASLVARLSQRNGMMGIHADSTGTSLLLPLERPSDPSRSSSLAFRHSVVRCPIFVFEMI